MGNLAGLILKHGKAMTEYKLIFHSMENSEIFYKLNTYLNSLLHNRFLTIATIEFRGMTAASVKTHFNNMTTSNVYRTALQNKTKEPTSETTN